MTLLVVTLSGSLGAVARHLVLVRFPPGASGFPLGVLGVNAAGSFAAGWAAGALDLASPVGVGVVAFLSGFTTFSTWMVDTVRLGVVTVDRRAVANLLGALVLGVGLAAAGYAIGG